MAALALTFAFVTTLSFNVQSVKFAATVNDPLSPAVTPAPVAPCAPCVVTVTIVASPSCTVTIFFCVVTLTAVSYTHLTLPTT